MPPTATNLRGRRGTGPPVSWLTFYKVVSMNDLRLLSHLRQIESPLKYKLTLRHFLDSARELMFGGRLQLVKLDRKI